MIRGRILDRLAGVNQRVITKEGDSNANGSAKAQRDERHHATSQVGSARQLAPRFAFRDS